MNDRPIRALLADDEPIAREILRVRLEREPDFEVVGEAEDGEGAVSSIRDLLPDLVFLDIEMPGLDGFDVIDRVGSDHLPHVVFVTAFDEFAVRAFEVHAVDYLLKPFDQSRLDRTLERVRENIVDEDAARGRLAALLDAHQGEDDVVGGEPEVERGGVLRRLILKHRDRYLLVPTEDVDWIESAGNYVRIHSGGRTFMMRATMTDMVKRLDSDLFARIHRSRIVNIDRIAEILPEAYGDFEVVLTTGDRLRMSRGFRANLLP